MFGIAVVFVFVLLSLLLFYVFTTAKFLRRFSRKSQRRYPRVKAPKTVVALCLRGIDEHLEECIKGLLRQKYKNYSIYIVIDSENDSAWRFVQKTIKGRRSPEIIVEALETRLETCSLKCSALVQMAERVQPDADVVAFIDGDVVPHDTWLKDLVAPFSESDTGATFGIPWYFPPQLGWGSVIRKVWWMPSGIVSLLAGWVWGGTMALRMDVLKHPSLTRRWSHALSSDTTVNAVVNEMGLRSVWVPSLFMPHYEETGLWFFCCQMFRYLLSTRLYLPFWWAVSSFVVALNAALLILVTTIVLSLNAGDPAPAIIATVGLIIYFGTLFILLLCVESTIRGVVQGNRHNINGFTLPEVVKLVLAIPAAHLCYLGGVIGANVAQSVSWRGVQYQISGSWNIRMQSHH